MNKNEYFLGQICIGKVGKNYGITSYIAHDNYKKDETLVTYHEYLDSTEPEGLLLFINKGGYAYNILNDRNTGYPIFQEVNQVITDEEPKEVNSHIKVGNKVVYDVEPLLKYAPNCGFREDSVIDGTILVGIFLKIAIEYIDLENSSNNKCTKREVLYQTVPWTGLYVDKRGLIRFNKALKKANYTIGEYPKWETIEESALEYKNGRALNMKMKFIR